MKLNKNTKELLIQLVNDQTSTRMPEQRGIFEYEFRSGLIYNLFRGNYKFSSSQFDEIFKFLSELKGNIDINLIEVKEPIKRKKK